MTATNSSWEFESAVVSCDLQTEFRQFALHTEVHTYTSSPVGVIMHEYDVLG